MRVEVTAIVQATVRELWTFDVPEVHRQALASDPEFIWDLFDEDAAVVVDVENDSVYDEYDRVTDKLEVLG
jgi:hypothetical protein